MRLALLRRLYEVTEGNTRVVVALDEVAGELNLDRGEALTVFEYLRGEGLAEFVAFGPQVSLTHYGILEVEATIRNPDRGTEHFSPPVIRQTIIIAEQITNSAIAVDSSGVHQTIGAVDRQELGRLIQQLREIAAELALPTEDEQSLGADLETVEAQLRSARPNGGVIRAALGSFQRVLEGAAGSAAGPAVATLVEQLANAIARLPI